MADLVCKRCGQTLPAIEGREVVPSDSLRTLVQTERLAGSRGIDVQLFFPSHSH